MYICVMIIILLIVIVILLFAGMQNKKMEALKKEHPNQYLLINSLSYATLFFFVAIITSRIWLVIVSWIIVSIAIIVSIYAIVSHFRNPKKQ